jgi:hypothetical protein
LTDRHFELILPKTNQNAVGFKTSSHQNFMSNKNLIEILTTPFNSRCNCYGCLDQHYGKISKSVEGREEEALNLLNDSQLCTVLNNGNPTVDYHTQARFVILFNLVSDPIVKINIAKKLILDGIFDLEIFKFIIIHYNEENDLGIQIATDLGLFSYITLIRNAYVYRLVPKLMENNIFSHTPEEIIQYTSSIATLDSNHFNDYFRNFHQKDLVHLLSMLFEEFINTKNEILVKPIQELHSLIDSQPKKISNYRVERTFIDLTNKILSTGDHEYLPFKTTNHGAKNLNQYLQITNKNNDFKKRIMDMTMQHNEKIMAVNNQITNHKETIQAIENKIKLLYKQKEHNIQSEKRISDLRQLGDLTPLERIKFIINSNNSIYFYPDFLFENITEEIDKLPQEYKSKLLDKLKTVKRGYLKKLKHYLSNNQPI